jgi:hypothetical protein
MTVFQMSDSDSTNDEDGPERRAQKQRERLHVSEAWQRNAVETKKLRHQRFLERQLRHEDDAKRVTAEKKTPACHSSSDETSDETSEESTGFESEAAVSVVAPAAMQRPPTREELANSNHADKFLVYLAVNNPGSSKPIPFIVLAQIKKIRRVHSQLFCDVIDFSCNQDQAHLLTIIDGQWDVARTLGRGDWNQDPERNYCSFKKHNRGFYALTKEQQAVAPRRPQYPKDLPVKLNCIDVGVNLVICILPRATSQIIISHGGYILSGTSSLIVSLLRASEHPHAVSFVESGKHERSKLVSNTVFEEKQKYFSDGAPKYPCGIKSCPAVLRWRHIANRHMQLHHALGPADPLLVGRSPKNRGHMYGCTYPCRVIIPGEDPCEFRAFKLFATANRHMKTSHGLLSGDDRLYISK